MLTYGRSGTSTSYVWQPQVLKCRLWHSFLSFLRTRFPQIQSLEVPLLQVAVRGKQFQVTAALATAGGKWVSWNCVERPQIPLSIQWRPFMGNTESLCLMLYSIAGAHSARLQGKLGGTRESGASPRSSLQSVTCWRESWQINSPPSTCQITLSFLHCLPRVPHGTELHSDNELVSTPFSISLLCFHWCLPLISK